MRFGIVPILLLAGGCATFEYDLVQPASVARHIGSKNEEIITLDSIEYRMITVDNRLVMRAYNTNDQPMTLNGDRSVLVDPDGQSHPLRTMTIAPRSFVKLILPPLPTRVERVGPSIGIGVGGVFGSARRARYYGYDYYGYDAPRYMVIYDNDAYFWTWTNEGEVRLTLAYEQGQTSVRHEFVIARRKM